VIAAAFAAAESAAYEALGLYKGAGKTFFDIQASDGPAQLRPSQLVEFVAGDTVMMG
jgi:hypothetical protein